MTATRRLTAILAADVAGYSRLMGADEEGTHERLKALRRELVDPKIAEHHGRLVKTTGDGMLVEFPSVVDAVRCAVEVQQAMAERNSGVDADNRIELRIGINLGDVIVEPDDIYGDGVNIAARIEALADPGGVLVSNTVYDQVRDRLPFVFEDLGEQQVKNIARPVRVYRVRDAATKTTSTPDPPVLPLPDKPSIAVLPFQNMSGDPEQEYFADGMVDEIITALSRIRWLFVIARNSSFTYKGQVVDVRQVGRELGVRYLLEGSVRRAGQRMRITGQLIDVITGTHLWADRFDGSLEDVFDLQDNVAISVAGAIEPTLQAAEAARAASRPTIDLTAYDLYLRALSFFYPLTKERIFVALDLLEQANAIDPYYPPALSWTAICHMRIFVDGWADAAETYRDTAIALARRALAATQDDPVVLANSAFVLAQLAEEPGAMIALVDRALTLNPSYARGWNISSQIRYIAAQYDCVIEHAATSLRLSPRQRVGNPMSVMGRAYFFKRQFDEAAAKFVLAVQEHPDAPHSYSYLAACYAYTGKRDKARAIIGRLRAITDQILPPKPPWQSADDHELLLSGLRKAAGEET